MVPHPARILRPFLLLLTALLALTAPTAAHAANITIASDNDQYPGIAVDTNGTGHVAFASSVTTGGNTVYDYSYCRIPRAATACAIRTRLITPGGGKSVPFGRAQVFVDGGNQRVIVIGEAIGSGPGNEGIFAWVSHDGGTTFDPPKMIADDRNVEHAVMAPDSNEIHIVDAVATYGIHFVTGSLTGPPGASFSIGDADPPIKQEYSDVGLLNSTTPFVIMTDGDTVYFKSLDSTKSAPGGPNNAANWKPAVVVDAGLAAEHVAAASGPSGSFILYKKHDYYAGGYGLTLRRVNEDGTIGAAQIITPDGANPIDFDMAEDANGRLTVVYKDNNDDNTIKEVWSKRGVTFSDPIVLTDKGEDGGVEPQIGVGPDGGGWVAFAHSNFHTPATLLALAPKGDADPAPTPKLVPGATPAPPTPTPLPCPAQVVVAPNVKAMVRTGDCFKNPDGKGKVFTTTGSVRVNGIDFTAPASGSFTVDTVAHTVKAVGAYKLSAGAVVLDQGNVTWDVTKVNTVSDLGGFGVKLFGFAVLGKADVTFDATGAAITINVQLPYPLDKINGQSTLHTTMANGLATTDVHVTASTIPIGPMEVRNLDISYLGANDQLEGKADVYLPPAAKSAISAAFGFQGGNFKHAELEVGAGVPPLPLPLWAVPPILLNRIGIAATSDATGFKMAGGVQIVAGASIAGLSPVSINALPSSGGGASLFIPKNGSYAVIAASGKLAILDIPVAYGGLSINTSGPLTFNGGTNLDFGIISVGVKMDGGINLSNGDFYAAAAGSACISLIDIEGCAKVEGILSSIGIAACGTLSAKEKISGLDASVSLGYDRKWGGSSNLGDCAIDDYKPASLSGNGARAAAARVRQAPGGQAFTLGSGDKQDVRVHGSGTLPGFTLTGPGGRTLTVPAGLTSVALGGNVAAVPVSADTIELQVHKPAGSWSIAPAAGSTIASVETATMLPTPKISGKVAKTGKGRTVTVKASNLGDQHLVIREMLTGGAGHELGTVKSNGTKTFRFTPADDKAGKRAIQAIVVTKDGRQVASPQIASYTAPAPAKLPAPRTVTLKRTNAAVSVKWSKVVGVDHYRVTIKASDGRLQVLSVPGNATSTTVPSVTTDDNVQIKVSAIAKNGREGAAKAATSKPVKPKATKKPVAKKKKAAKKK